MNDLKDFMGCNNLINAIREGDLDTVKKIKSDIDRSPLDFTHKVSKYNNRTPYSFAANAPGKRFDLLLIMPWRDGFDANFKIADDQNRTPLMYAVNYGDSDAIGFLKRRDSESLSRVDNDGRNLLHLLCLPGDWSPRTYSILDKNNVMPFSSSIHQLKADSDALKKAAESILRGLGLLAIQEQLRTKDRFGMTPIDYAAGFGFNFLINLFENYTEHDQPKPIPVPEDITIFGRNALQRYIVLPTSNKTYKDQLPNLLIKYDVRTPNPENGNINAIQLAYFYNKDPDFIALLEADLISKDPKGLLARDNTGAMALHYAAQANVFNSVDCIKRHLLRLKRQGILNKAINHKDKEGRTALHVLVMTHTDDDSLKKQIEAYSCLLTYGAEVFPVDNNGHTPYDLAKLYGNDKLADAISKLASPKLLDPPKQNLKDYLDRDFVIRCVLSGNLNLQDYLKEKRFVETINTPVARYGNMAPLHFVAQALKHQTQLAKILIDKGAKVDQLDVMQRAPIFYAANLRDKDLISLYLSQKPELRYAVDKDGRNLIHAFCMGGLFKNGDKQKAQECLEFLLPQLPAGKAKSMLTAPDKFGIAPVAYALYNQYDEISDVCSKYDIDYYFDYLPPTDHGSILVLHLDFYGFNPVMQSAYKSTDFILEYYKDWRNLRWGGDNGLHFWQEWYFKDNFDLADSVLSRLRPNNEPLIANSSGSTIVHLRMLAIACNPSLLRRWLASKSPSYFTEKELNRQDHKGNTALHVIAMMPRDLYPGAENGNYCVDERNRVLPVEYSNPTIIIAKKLIDSFPGIGIYIKNSAGQTAYDVALQYGNTELSDYLLRRMLQTSPQQEVNQNYSLVSGCLQFGYNSVKKLAGRFTVNSTATQSHDESVPEDSNLRPLLGVTKQSCKA